MYAKTTTRQLKFDGALVTVTIRRLTMADAVALSSMDKSSAAQMNKIREHVLKIEGLLDVDGTPISVDEVFSEFYFSPLIAAITAAVFETGTLAEGAAVPFGER